MNNTAPILVTGASTGIGNCLVRYLAGRGHTVYATARKDIDLQALGQIEGVIPLGVDVRQPGQVQAAVQEVVERGLGLYGLVNNAGVGVLGPFSTWTDEEMFDIFDVNVFGPHRMTNACLPLLLAAKGRIVNIGSQGGMITSRYYGPYTMTKHALEAYTTALHEELWPHGVMVSIVQPGGIVTNVGENSFSGTKAHFERAEPPFREDAEQVLVGFEAPETPRSEDEPESAANRKPSSPEIVAAAVYDALFSAQPKLRYLVGTRWEGMRVLNALVERLLDENDNPVHNLDRDELVKLLDEHLARRSGSGRF
ncbi:MAG TPA: SDR family oxidoreductase [Anaerolineales bacterium]|nr:SDR family oxidoreductase [Anaerolineales bacterium]